MQYSDLNRLENTVQLFDKGEVRFVNVEAQYPTKKNLALSKFDLTICPGEKVGIVGQTGSGKSTIIKLLSQYLTQKQGQILIDGLDITKLDLQILRSQYLLLSQEAVSYTHLTLPTILLV